MARKNTKYGKKSMMKKNPGKKNPGSHKSSKMRGYGAARKK